MLTEDDIDLKAEVIAEEDSEEMASEEIASEEIVSVDEAVIGVVEE